MKSMEIYESSEITVQRLNELRDLDKKIQILDVREDTERDHAHVKGTIHIKLTEIAKRHIELEKNKNIFVMCHTGTRSQTVVKWLKSQGYMHSVNVLGGIDAWAALIDIEIRRY
jgi:rhodanese-related sulfurtransferase